MWNRDPSNFFYHATSIDSSALCIERVTSIYCRVYKKTDPFLLEPCGCRKIWAITPKGDNKSFSVIFMLVCCQYHVPRYMSITWSFSKFCWISYSFFYGTVRTALLRCCTLKARAISTKLLSDNLWPSLHGNVIDTKLLKPWKISLSVASNFRSESARLRRF